MVIREREPTPTKPGKIRICLDPSQTVNKTIRRPKYTIPTLEENLQKLHGVKYMSVIDVEEAFQNIPLTLRSSLMTTMFRPWGRYRWTKLPFGISSASEEWQNQIDMVLEGLNVSVLPIISSFRAAEPRTMKPELTTTETSSQYLSGSSSIMLS